MKSKLRGFGLKRRETKDKFDLLPPAQLDELAQAARVFSPSVFDAFEVYLLFLEIRISDRSSCQMIEILTVSFVLKVVH